jgi:phage FluMu gp28-like protein
MNVYLDEFAHAQYDRMIYMAALPIISKGGRLRIGSSPMGATGTFWEVFSERLRQYPGYKRNSTPWWETHSFCVNPLEARKRAPEMLTVERVGLYGTDRLKTLHDNMLEEDFQQEYECAFVDESTAWISWELIKRAQHPELRYWNCKSTHEVAVMIDTFLSEIAQGKVELSFTGGIDVGRKHDLTECFVVGKAKTGHAPVRIIISLDRVPFDEQQACFEMLLSKLPFVSVLIDQNGIGMQLAEQLNRRFNFAQGVSFTNQTKELWAVEARLQFERGNVMIPLYRDLAYQIHSIKKQVTKAKNNVFDTETNEKHHADKFWALALALWAQKTSMESNRVYAF